MLAWGVLPPAGDALVVEAFSPVFLLSSMYLSLFFLDLVFSSLCSGLSFLFCGTAYQCTYWNDSVLFDSRHQPPTRRHGTKARSGGGIGSAWSFIVRDRSAPEARDSKTE